MLEVAPRFCYFLYLKSWSVLPTIDPSVGSTNDLRQTNKMSEWTLYSCCGSIMKDRVFIRKIAKINIVVFDAFFLLTLLLKAENFETLLLLLPFPLF